MRGTDDALSILAPEPDIEWTDEGHPRSRRHEDVYFSRHGGLSETRHVFLQGNQLPERFASLDSGSTFVITETGFGTGLNFLAAWQCWVNAGARNSTLHYIGIERAPLRSANLSRALELWPELRHQTKRLIQAYPSCCYRGFHRLNFKNVGICLTLVFNDVGEALRELLDSDYPALAQPDYTVDAWFLDGFSPRTNPSMWDSDVLSGIALLSGEGTTLATFTAAGAVRRGLEAQGFEVSKRPGFGHKREMMEARFQHHGRLEEIGLPESSPFPDGNEAPWHLTDNAPGPAGSTVAVVGGGLAGCHVARALADRGYSVTLIEREPTLAAGASGNPQGVLYGRVSHQQSPLADFNLAALTFAQAHYAQLAGASRSPAGTEGSPSAWFTRSGVLMMTSDEATESLRTAFGEQGLFHFLSAEEASVVAGVALNQGGLLFPDSGWLRPPGLCHALVNDTPINRVQATVTNLTEDGGRWWLTGPGTSDLGPFHRVILSCANEVTQFTATQDLPLRPVRGQLSLIESAHAPGGSNLIMPLCHDGYITPASEGRLSFGASFRPNESTMEPTMAEHRDNIQKIHRQFPGLLDPHLDAEACQARVGLRCTTPDRLPMVGPVPRSKLMRERFALLSKNANATVPEKGVFHRELYLCCGFGSRGLAYIPLCAELLAAHINAEPLPLGRTMRRALHPARFLVRNLVRGR